MYIYVYKYVYLQECKVIFCGINKINRVLSFFSYQVAGALIH